MFSLVSLALPSGSLSSPVLFPSAALTHQSPALRSGSAMLCVDLFLNKSSFSLKDLHPGPTSTTPMWHFVTLLLFHFFVHLCGHFVFICTYSTLLFGFVLLFDCITPFWSSCGYIAILDSYLAPFNISVATVVVFHPIVRFLNECFIFFCHFHTCTQASILSKYVLQELNVRKQMTTTFSLDLVIVQRAT